MRRLFGFVLAWTLALLALGSIVHATESSLACPDWPTCFGTLTPEMTGGVFWEHLHRLWAGALVLLFTAAVVLLRRRRPELRTVFRLGLAGVAALLVQSVLGGLTVIYGLPDAISVSHLTLALAFVVLLTVMTARVGEPWTYRTEESRKRVRRAGTSSVRVIFIQSFVGGLVRHQDAGMACPDIPLCLGSLVPPLGHPLVRIHYMHRVLGVLAMVIVLRHAWLVLRRSSETAPRRAVAALAGGAVLQVAFGFASVAFSLDPPYVVVHTAIAGVLLVLAATLVGQARPGATVAEESGPSRSGRVAAAERPPAAGAT